jgi:hypothetical protein
LEDVARNVAHALIVPEYTIKVALLPQLVAGLSSEMKACPLFEILHESHEERRFAEPWTSK